MINGARVVVVLPAYNAERTLGRTFAEVPPGVVDQFLLVDDASGDGTVAEAARLGIPYLVHSRNRGYGGEQKTCFTQAVGLGGGHVVMLYSGHPHTPPLVGGVGWVGGPGGVGRGLGRPPPGRGAA